jgi:acyl carrier protein
MTTETPALDTQSLLAGLAEIINEVSGIKTDKVTLDATFKEDLGLDSLTMIEIVTAAEDKFGQRIDDDDAANLFTVQDAVSYIQDRAAQAA